MWHVNCTLISELINKSKNETLSRNKPNEPGEHFGEWLNPDRVNKSI